VAEAAVAGEVVIAEVADSADLGEAVAAAAAPAAAGRTYKQLIRYIKSEAIPTGMASLFIIIYIRCER
jgi:hypothetical protein